MKLRHKIAAGIASLALLAGCGLIGDNPNSDIQYIGVPTFTLHLEPVPYINQLVWRLKYKENYKPQEIHVHVTIFKWEGREAKSVKHEVFRLKDLPGVGKDGVIHVDMNCEPGDYFSEVYAYGVTHKGNYDDLRLYYPYAKGTKKSKHHPGRFPPSRKLSWHIRHC